MQGQSDVSISHRLLERLFSSERLSTYIAQCDGDFDSAIELYRWNAAIALPEHAMTSRLPAAGLGRRASG
jgi:hypothetical protein